MSEESFLKNTISLYDETNAKEIEEENREKVLKMCLWGLSDICYRIGKIPDVDDPNCPIYEEFKKEFSIEPEKFIELIIMSLPEKERKGRNPVKSVVTACVGKLSSDTLSNMKNI